MPPLVGGLFGGGRGLGNAQGSISIDTSDAQRAAQDMRRIGRNIQSDLSGVGRAADTVGRKTGGAFSSLGTRIQGISRSIRGLRTELLAVGALGGILTGIGLNTAGALEEARIQLKGMVGSERDAIRLMGSLREQASKAGLPFEEMLTASRQLLPTLEGSTTELEKWLPLVRRVAVLNRREGLAGAAFAINEALTSGGTDLVSLTERFNISRVQLREALAQTGGDFAAALDLVLGRMGITIETADEMGQTFNAALTRAKDAAGQALAAGFTPLLEALTPIFQRTAEWLTQLQQTNPEVLKLGAGILAVATVGAPTLVFLGQVVETLQKIRQLSIAGTLGRAGVLGGAALAGGFAGLQIGRAVGRATGNESVANTTISDVGRIIRQAVFVVAAGLSEIVVRVRTLMINAQEAFNNGIVSMVGAMAGFVRTIGDVLPDVLGGARLREMADNIDAFNERLQVAATEQGDRERTGTRDAQRDFLLGLQRFLGLGGTQATATEAGGTPSGAEEIERINQERTEAIVGWYEEIKAIERNQLQQRLQQEQQYQEQRSAAIRQFNQTLAREEEDFLRQRARQVAQLQRDIERIRQESLEREQEWLADLNDRIQEITAESNERIAELTEDSNGRIEDLQEEHQRRLEQAAAESRNRILDAASRLDARAVAEEQRRFALQTQQANSELQRRIDQERENLAERIQQEQEAHNERIEQEREAHAERLEEARRADEERIADMRASLAEQQRIEDEDRAIRLQRMREDHNAQLEELKQANIARLQEINRQANEERLALNQRFQKELADLGEATESYLQLQQQKQDEALELFEQYWSDWNRIVEGQKTGGRPGFASGGAVNFTGLAQLHGTHTRPEFVLNASTTDALRGMLGNFTQRGLVSAVAGGGGVNVGSIPISISTTGGNPQDIADALEARLLAFFNRMAA